MLTSKNTPFRHEAIVHGSTTTKAILHNDHKKPQQEVPHNLKEFSLLSTLVISIFAISICRSTTGGETKASLKWKERGNDPLPLPPTKNPNQAYQMHEDVMAQTNSVI
jgi:hypothetical protein